MFKPILIAFIPRRSRKECIEGVGVLLLSSCWLFGVAAPTKATGQTSVDARELVLNTSIQRELSVGETHHYGIKLALGDYLRLSIQQKDIKLESKLFHSESTESTGVVNDSSTHGVVLVLHVAEAAGSYRLEIRAAEGAKAGRYEIRLEERRPATERDRIYVAGERAEGQGRDLMFNAPPAERRRQGIAKYKEALALWRKIGDNKGVLRVLVYLATQHELLGEPQASLEFKKQALETARAEGDRYQEANQLLGFGVFYINTGETQKALDSLNQARQIFKSQSKKYGEALALYNIVLAMTRIGEFQNALPYLEEALPTLSSVGDHYTEANILNIMGKIHRSMGDKQKAVEFHNRALGVARAAGSLQAQALSFGHLGNVYVAMGDNQKALDCFEQALKLCRTSGNRLFEADAMKRIGDTAYLSKDYQKALDYLNGSLDLYRSSLERVGESETLHSLAEVNYALGELDLARRQIEQALERKEAMRSNVISQQLREAILTSAQASFALCVDLLMQLHKKDTKAGHETAALQTTERARARSLLEVLSESQADIREGAPKNLLELERSLQRQINAKAAARTRLLSDKRTQAQAASFDKEIAELTARFRETEVEIRRSSPRYAALTQPQPLTSTQIQQQLDDSTVLLEFALGANQGWLWAVTPSTINSYQLPLSAEIEASARKVYELLTARQPQTGETEAQYQSRVKEAESNFQRESAKLSQTLLGQVAARLQQDWKGKRLAIVAPGALEYIPFAALPVPHSENLRNENRQPAPPLITQHEIVNLPSASALAAIRSESEGRKQAERTIAILADPVFDLGDSRLQGQVKKSTSNDTSKVRSGAQVPLLDSPRSITLSYSALDSFRSLSKLRAGFSRLPFSREEADAIASLVPETSLMKATDFQANRSTAMSEQLSHYRMIHFATHGLLNSEHPELSGLVLSLVDEKGNPQDGFLRMNEIYNLKLPAELVVLSACQTALGKQIKGEGLVGLTRGFMYAGAQRVVASLWQVHDLATAELMKSFYRGMLVDGLRPAAALRAAQLQTRKQKRWSSPFYWAAFTIQGEWR